MHNKEQENAETYSESAHSDHILTNRWENIIPLNVHLSNANILVLCCQRKLNKCDEEVLVLSQNVKHGALVVVVVSTWWRCWEGVATFVV